VVGGKEQVRRLFRRFVPALCGDVGKLGCCGVCGFDRRTMWRSVGGGDNPLTTVIGVRRGCAEWQVHAHLDIGGAGEAGQQWVWRGLDGGWARGRALREARVIAEYSGGGRLHECQRQGRIMGLRGRGM